MVPDISTFVAACTICEQNKTPRQAPAGLLQPLPVPHRPWSHIYLDLVTGLPPSDGNTPIQFSKAAHFIPLPKLHSAKEAAQLLVQHVFQIHGLRWVLSSHPSSGRCLARSLGRRPACPPGSTRSLMTNWNEPIRTWKRHFVAFSPPTPPPGASNLCSWCTPATPSPAQPLVSRLLCVP
jgi:hypothetical protein